MLPWKETKFLYDFIIECSYTFIIINKIFQVELTLLSGKMDQEMRSRVFSEFSQQKSGALFCTNVAARGLGILSKAFFLLVVAAVV